MFYKIENIESEVYKKLYALRSFEIQIKKDNESIILEKTGLEWKGVFGVSSQQNFRRVPQYTGFSFLEPEKVDAKTWKKHATHENVFIPNKKTKQGREMAEFLLNGLKGSNFNQVFDILQTTNHPRQFTLPFVEIIDNLIILFIDDQQEPKDENVIEITKREFNQLLEKL